MKAVCVSTALALLGIIVALVATAQGPPPPPIIGAAKPWAEVIPEQGVTIVVLRDTQGSDQVIVTTFYKQKLKGLDAPVVRAITDVIGAVKDTAVAANGAPEPKDVTEVHLSLVKVTDRMSWSPPPPVNTQPK